MSPVLPNSPCDGKQYGLGKFIRRRWICPHNNLSVTHTNLVLEWDYERNDNKIPENYTHTHGSYEMIIWKCTINPAIVYSRTRKPNLSDCPFCSSEWHYELNYPSRSEQFRSLSKDRVFLMQKWNM